MTPLETASLFSDILLSQVQRCMIGTIVPAAWGIAPDGFLLCDGATYNRVDYPKLYEVIDSFFHLDADTFTVPNLISTVIAGAGNWQVGTETISIPPFSKVGEFMTAIGVQNLPAHTHAIEDHTHDTIPHSHVDAGHVHTEIAAVDTVVNGGLEAPAPSATAAPVTTGIGTANIQPETVTVSSAHLEPASVGEGEPIGIVQPTTALNFYIVAK